MKSGRYIFSFVGLLFLFVAFFGLSETQEEATDFTERVKIALRDVGNGILLSQGDSTSLVMPVVQLDKSKYRLAFENPLSFEPGTLVSITKDSFSKNLLPKYYRVEVTQCNDGEVAYSYEIKNKAENDIIPCAGRFLPEKCYIIEVKFTNKIASSIGNKNFLYILLPVGLVCIGFLFFRRKKEEHATGNNSSKFLSLGSFKFYPEQNKLVKGAKEINLSKKECELLAIFIENPNQIVKRDELTKKVWEDNGVIVGRSLDTYISKLRKLLKEDDSIKLTNVHGVGYKLEVGT